MKKRHQKRRLEFTGNEMAVIPNNGIICHQEDGSYCLKPLEGNTTLMFLSPDATKFNESRICPFCHGKPRRSRQFIHGAAKLFDFAGTLDQYADLLSTEEADVNALRADWGAVGKDLYDALVIYDRAKSK